MSKPEKNDSVRLADVRLSKSMAKGAAAGTILGLLKNHRDNRKLAKTMAELGKIVGTQWVESDERDRAMLEHTRALRRLTVWIAAMTVVSTGFVIYSALR